MGPGAMPNLVMMGRRQLGAPLLLRGEEAEWTSRVDIQSAAIDVRGGSCCMANCGEEKASEWPGELSLLGKQVEAGKIMGWGTEGESVMWWEAKRERKNDGLEWRCGWEEERDKMMGWTERVSDMGNRV